MNCKFKCMKCRCDYETVKAGPTQCPNCGSLYVEWLNWKEVLTELYNMDSKSTSYVP